MPRKKRTWDECIEILAYLEQHDMRDAAQQFHMTIGALNSWLFRLRRRITQTQTKLNMIRSMQKRSPRIRKITTDGSIRAVEKEEEEEEKWE